MKYCIAGHAERNALANAAKNGICTEGTVLYSNLGPCVPCAVDIINHGVKELVLKEGKFYDEEAEFLIKASKVQLRIFGG